MTNPFWRVESIEDGRTRSNGRFSSEVDARKWAGELAEIQDVVLVWECRKTGILERRTLVLRLKRPKMETGRRGGF